VPATQVSQNGGLAQKDDSVAVTATAFVRRGTRRGMTGHIDGVGVIAICITCSDHRSSVIFRTGSIIDILRMQIAADPNKYNVK
jgi:hypothetical protein